MERISKISIIEHMKIPETMTLKDVMESYSYLCAEFAAIHVELSKCHVDMAVTEAKIVGEGGTSARARQVAKGTDAGLKAILLTADLKGTEELIRALKKMQAYYSLEATNQV